MSVSRATVGSPAPPATSTSAPASSSAASRAGRKAPEPNLTSMTSASSPAASFFERIEATISGSDSTVPVASRIAYRRRSAGATSAVWPTIAQPTSSTTRWSRSTSGLVVVAGHAVELVERAAGVAEAAAGDHRHRAAAGGDDRRQHQRDLVADPAGRVLVEHRAAEVPLQDLAGVRHRGGQGDALVLLQPAQEHGHRQRADLGVRQRAVGDAVDQEADLLAAERVPVALAADDLRGEHRTR